MIVSNWLFEVPSGQGIPNYTERSRFLDGAGYVTDVAGYAAGIILIAISPFTAGSTAAVGGYIIAGTSAVDIAGDIGLYIYGRNR